MRSIDTSCASSWRKRVVLGSGMVVSAWLFAAAAYAQMQLPGAIAPTGEGATVAPASAPKPKPKGPPPPPKVPGDDGLLNRTLEQNGRVGVLQFMRDGKDLKLARVTLAGEKIARPSETCEVETPGMPLAIVPNGRPHGVTSYTAALEGCPIAFDVLDGAVLVTSANGTCTFQQAGCRIDPAGLWGQPANEIGAGRTKEIERARAPAEQSMRNNFRSWIEGAGKDRELIRRISSEQAGFSSRRSEVCDSYAREADHGYCALLLTQARSVALASRVAPPPLAPPPDQDQFGAGRRKKR